MTPDAAAVAVHDSLALASRDPEQESRAILATIKVKLLRRYAGMYEPANSPDYNPDGELPRSHVPMRTAAAVEAVNSMLRGADSGSGNVTINIRHLSLPQKEEAREYTDAVVVEKPPGD